MNVAEFIATWRKVELKERSAAQEHFLDLCRLVGHPTPSEADPTGADFCFEKGAAKHDIPIESLGEPRNIEVLRAVFHSPETLHPGRTSTAVTEDAARHSPP